MAYDYLRDPAEIYRQSFACVEREADLTNYPGEIKKVATRLIHSCGMTDIVDDLEFSENAGKIGVEALRSGCAVFCDVEMVKAGIIEKNLPDGCKLICTLNDERVAKHGKDQGNTRSAAGVDFWDGRLNGAIAVVGNAPTALFRLLERVEEGAGAPALVIGIPVGFIGAIESKQALADCPLNIPFITVHGRRGGSAMASSALNALAFLANERS